MHKKQPMKLTIPNIESLPPDHHLNRQIDGLNRDQRMDQVYRASVASAIARFLAERLRADSDLDWIREVNRLIDGIPLHTPTVENVYADLGETERMMAPAKTGSGSFPITFSIVLAIIATLIALLELSRLYRECKLGWLGTEIQAGVVEIPVQNYRGDVKYIYVGIGGYAVPVMISSRAYARKRFKVGQVITVKYHAASGWATLSGEIDGFLIFGFMLFSIPATVFWIDIYRKIRGR